MDIRFSSPVHTQKMIQKKYFKFCINNSSQLTTTLFWRSLEFFASLKKISTFWIISKLASNPSGQNSEVTSLTFSSRKTGSSPVIAQILFLSNSFHQLCGLELVAVIIQQLLEDYRFLSPALLKQVYQPTRQTKWNHVY